MANYLDKPQLTGVSGAKLGYASLEIPSVDTDGISIPWAIKNTYGASMTGNLPLPRYWGGYKSGTVQYPIDAIMPYGPTYLTYQGMQPSMSSNFKGQGAAGVAAYQGAYQLWGGRADLLNNKATLAAPITLGAGASLSFMANTAIEEGWDFGFVQVSTDGGATWTSLANASTTSVCDPSAHPDVVANLPGFTGNSGGWKLQSFDLSAYAGQSVLVRFLYVTDWASNEAGFYVDQVTIADASGTRFADNFEAGSANWVLDGWKHTTGQVSCDWGLTLVNPVYVNGKYDHTELKDASVFLDNGWQRAQTSLNTIGLYNDVATVILSNKMPEADSTPAKYQILVKKGTAK